MVGSGKRIHPRREILLLIGLVTFALIGRDVALGHTKPYPPSDAPLANAPPIFGWAMLAIAAGVAYLTMNQWAKVLSGWLVVSVLNGLLTIESGHLVNQPDKPLARSTAATMTFCLAASAFFASTFVSRKLTTIDRIMLTCVCALYLFVFWLGNSRCCEALASSLVSWASRGGMVEPGGTVLAAITIRDLPSPIHRNPGDEASFERIPGARSNS